MMKIPWGHHIVIIGKSKGNRDKALFYVRNKGFLGSVWYYIARRWTRRQYSGLKDCRVLEYDTGQQVPGKHLL